MRRAPALAATILLLAPAVAAPAGPPRDFRLGQAVQGRQPTKVLAYLDVRDGDAKPVDLVDPGSVSATLGDQSLQVDRVVPFSDAGEGVGFIFCVDISRSLSAADFAAVRNAMGRWIDEMRPLDRAAVLSFGEASRLVLDFSADKAALRAALEALGPTDMQTVLYRGLLDALELSSRRDPELPARRVVVVLSDGKDEGSALAAEDVLDGGARARASALCDWLRRPPPRESLDLLLRFATNSGGDFVAVGGGDFDRAYGAMREAIDRVWVAELTCPACEADGAARRLQVNLRLSDRVLSKGIDLRLLPPLASGAPVAAAPAAAPAAVATPPPSASGTAAGVSAPAWRRGWLLWSAIAAAVALVIVGAALAARRLRAGAAATDAGGAAPKRRRTRQHLTRRERKQLDVPLDSEPLVPPLALCLTVVRGAAEGTEHRFLLHRRGVLGSGGRSDFVVAEPELAAEQVELVQGDGAVYGRNLSRSQPTLVNGAPLVDTKPIGSGDLLGNRGFIARVRLG